MRREATYGLTNLLWQLSDLIKYISNVVRRESDDNMNDNNHTRNGPLLANHLHVPFGAGDIASLKTSDFGLTVDDIPYNLPNAAGPASRLTLHHFADLPQPGSLIPNIAPHNSDARQPQDTSEWPPAVIVDLFYAAAAMNVWSPKSFIKYVREESSDAYCPEGEDEDEDNDNVSDSSGLSHVDAQMSDQTAGQPESGRYTLRARAVDAVFEDGREKTEDAHASSLSRNESVKKLLESVEDPKTN
ncbi:hypothetical protein K443DRAFT_4711 [Laccaria amethystina LaAM-08-1]|uniref:Uncharacterized protein n=1 Tax=Laccaria amethystina LaAM-08-1 TaxID=1095629 RepID=A0A0C9XGY9_9AGAR|nr:hypothetical protein K443DRAFT_4711 [Laccaria amethystina LaAM-08-1]